MSRILALLALNRHALIGHWNSRIRPFPMETLPCEEQASVEALNCGFNFFF